MIEVRQSPDDGYIAQRLPDLLAEKFPDSSRRWLCMSWPQGLLTATMLTEEEVADWPVIYHEDG